MAQIKNVDGLTVGDVHREVEQGGRFVMYKYCISIVVMTFQRGSDIYFVRGDESALKYGYPYVFISLALGWWGIPFGPIFTITSLFTNFSGGKDVTQVVLDSYRQEARPVQV